MLNVLCVPAWQFTYTVESEIKDTQIAIGYNFVSRKNDKSIFFSGTIGG